jgi:hypothetical protein
MVKRVRAAADSPATTGPQSIRPFCYRSFPPAHDSARPGYRGFSVYVTAALFPEHLRLEEPQPQHQPQEIEVPGEGPGSKSAEIYLSVLYARSTPEFHLPFPVTLYLSPELQSP